MNYIYYFKQQTITFTFIALSFAITYGIACHFGWKEPIILTTDYIIIFVSYLLTFIFIGPFIFKWMDILNK
jgi:hypothetical protein